MRQKAKIVLLAALTVGAACYGRHYSYSSLETFFVSVENHISRLAFETVMPAAFYTNDGDGYTISTVVNAVVGLVQYTVFSSDEIPGDVENEALVQLNEYYPSPSELEEYADEDPSVGEDPEVNVSEETENMEDTAQGADNDIIPAVATPANGIIYPEQSLYDYTFLMNNFYITDSSTSSDASLIDGETLLNRDLTIDLSGDSPKILIYHTHSQEKFADSRPGEVADTVVGLGNTLTDILQQKYDIEVYHDTGVYDMVNGVEDRNEAYSLAQTAVENILSQYPSIKVVIDLHRDGVAEGTRLVTEINGKSTAKIMFFNGLCRSADNETEGYLQNPYLTDNLAFSLQMQIKAAEKYPDFTRRIYLRDYRYNMHLCPRSLLVECGAQTNTVEEVQNAMEPLADLLYCVLSGQ